MVNKKALPPPLEFSNLCSTFEAKIIAPSDVVLRKAKGNTWDSYIING